MKITKYPQSCLMIETNNKKILVDPGKLKFDERFIKEWEQADIILVTHKHGDHFHEAFLSTTNIPIYSSKEVQNTYSNIHINCVKENDILEFDEIKVEVVKAIHGYNPRLKNSNEVDENIGFIINDGSKRLYITSDTLCFNHDYKADIIALPVTGYGLTMTAFEASLMAAEMNAFVLPVHMDNEVYPPNLEFIEESFKKENVSYQILEIEETIVI